MRDFWIFAKIDVMIDNTLISYMEEMLKNTPTAFKRYAYSEIDWNQRMIGIVGARGIGKSTMVKQYIIENREQFNIDEVHKYENWSRELKQIYDIHSELKVILTGSSILDIQKGEVDLSRRIVIYEMYGLSFREYLKMFHNINAETYSLEDILNHKVSLKEPAHPLPYFKQYLKEGYYPFAIEGSFSLKMQQVVTLYPYTVIKIPLITIVACAKHAQANRTSPHKNYAPRT